MTERPPFPFIVGSIRSGTTLLRLMLDAHPDMAIPPESYFPRRLWQRRVRYQRKDGIDLGALADDLLHDPSLFHFRDNWGIDPALVRTHFQGVAAIEFDDALRRIYLLWAQTVGKSRYGDKTPAFVLAIEELAQIWPEARFVHLIRDGRDVTQSVLELHHPDHPRSIVAMAQQWAEWVRIGCAAGMKLGPARYLEIHYEELVRAPESTLRTICEFIELDYSPLMLEPQRRGTAAIPSHERWQHPRLDRAPTVGLRDWRRDMTPGALARFEAVAGADLEAAGYERGAQRLPISARIAAFATKRRAAVRATASALRAWTGLRELSGSPWPSVLMIAAVLATAAFAIRGLGERSLWIDEAVSIYAVIGPNTRWVHWLWQEPQFILFHVLLRGWSVLGSSEFIMRSLSTVFAVLTVPVQFAVARRLYGDRAGGVAVALISVNGFFLGYAQEARPYALVLLTSTSATLCLLRAIERPDRLGRWTSWILTSLVAVLSHPFGGLVVLAHIVVLLLQRRPVPWRDLAYIAAVPTAMVGALAFRLFRSGSGPISWIPVAHIRTLAHVAKVISGGHRASLLAYGVGITALVWVTLRPTPHRRQTLGTSNTIAACWLFVPIVVALLVSQFQPVFIARYLIVALTPSVLLVGAGIGQLRPLVAAAGTAAIVATSLQGAMVPVREEPLQDWRGAATIVTSEGRPDDLIVVSPWGIEAFRYYLEREQMDHSPSTAVGDWADVARTVPANIRSGSSTVWVLTPLVGVAPNVGRSLAATHVMTQRWNLDGVEVTRYDRNADATAVVP